MSADRSIALAPAEIHLWLAFYDRIGDEGLHAAYRALLAPEELEQESRFYFERDRLRYLVTRALVRTVLSRYLPIAPREWTFTANRYGRPEIANAAAAGSGLIFNLSHTHSVIALGVTASRALGVDVENVRAREVSLGIADRFFAPREVADLAAVPPRQRQDRFFEYWTFKESYIKARGMGLSLPLDKFSFHYPHESGVEIAIDPALSDPPARWQFWQFRPAPEYLAAICAERGGPVPRVTVRQVVPMRSEEPFVPEFTRVSEHLRQESLDERFRLSRPGLAETRDGSRAVR